MKIVFRYTRLPKKRGGWRYPLRVTLKAAYSSEEEERFNPNFTLRYKGTFPSAATDAESWLWVTTREKTDQYEYGQYPDGFHVTCPAGTKDVEVKVRPMDDVMIYCLTSDIREAAIGVLHEAYESFCGIVDEWWLASAPAPGDAVPTVLEHVIGDSEHCPTQVRRRVISVKEPAM